MDVSELHCSFCGKPRTVVAHIVCGPTPDVAICNECVALVTEIMDETDEAPKPSDESPGSV
jgi:ATP-dependent protease Clp ATPase subunit